MEGLLAATVALHVSNPSTIATARVGLTTLFTVPAAAATIAASPQQVPAVPNPPVRQGDESHFPHH